MHTRHDDAPEGPPQQVTAGIEMVRAALCADGRGWHTQATYRLQRFPRSYSDWPSGNLGGHRPTHVRRGRIESIDVSQDGRLVVSSDGRETGFVDTACKRRDLQQLTTDPALDAGPRWKPDGSEIAFYSSRTGHREVWVMPVGGDRRQITRGESESYYPTWSPDGQEMVKFGTGISVVPNQGGEERRLTRDSRDLYPSGRPTANGWCLHQIVMALTGCGVSRPQAAGRTADERPRLFSPLVTRWKADLLH